MTPPSGITLRAATRSSLVLTGLLLFAVGLGNLVAGQSKVVQYEQLVRATTVHLPPRDPAGLFPPVSEGAERSDVARAKLAFYQLLVIAGRLLAALGAALVGLGGLRLWMRAARDSTAAN